MAMRLLSVLLLAAVALPGAGESRQRLTSVAPDGPGEYHAIQQMGVDVTAVQDSCCRCTDAPCRTLNLPGFYHTYPQVRDTLCAIARRLPAICRLETLGYSVQGRLLLGLRVSDNVALREVEPRLRMDGNIHGNERLGCEVVMHLAHVLADSYGLSTRLTRLVDEHELLLVPMANPDGAVANQLRNANNVNLNRDFGYMWDAWGGSTDFFSQPETRALRRDAERHAYSMSLTFHTGLVSVLYPWGFAGQPTADDRLYKRLARGYADILGYDTSNCYRWNQIHGASLDCSYGLDGTLELTPELHMSNPPAESIEHYCRVNKDAVLGYFRWADAGLHGVVTDAASGTPLLALVRIGPLPDGRQWFCYTSRDNGDFHRPVLPGTYTLRVSANGYHDTTITGIRVTDTTTPVWVDIALTPGHNYSALRLMALRQNDTTCLICTSQTIWCLGMPDRQAFPMSFGGRLVLDMGVGTEIIDGPGPDFVVVEHPDNGDTILVAVGPDWCGPWTTIGLGIGTCSLDLSLAGVAEARYLLIRDVGRRRNTGPTAGYNLDAVFSINHNIGVEEHRTNLYASRTTPEPTIVRGVLFLPASCVERCASSVLLDITGRKVLDLTPGPNDVSRLAPGVYFVRAVGRERSAESCYKVIVN